MSLLSKNIFLHCILLGFLAALPVFSAISGTVINSMNSEPVVGVTVSLNGTNESTLSDENGRFVLLNTPTKANYADASGGFQQSMGQLKAVAVHGELRFSISGNSGTSLARVRAWNIQGEELRILSWSCKSDFCDLELEPINTQVVILLPQFKRSRESKETLSLQKSYLPESALQISDVADQYTASFNRVGYEPLLNVEIMEGQDTTIQMVPLNECNDGIDNDGDGFVDYAYDQGCYGPGDVDETAGTRADEDGWTTYDLPEGVPVYYVSADGDDDNSGLSPDSALTTWSAAINKHVEGESMWVLFKRGDVFEFSIGLSEVFGESPENPLLVSSYGNKMERPVFLNGRVSGNKPTANISVIGLHFKPAEPFRDNEGSTSTRVVGSHEYYLLEDNVFEYGQITFQEFGDNPDVNNITIRRNSILNAYSTNSHAQGVYTGKVDGLVIEENLFDHNGWLIQRYTGGQSADDAQATYFNHNMYLSGSKNITVANNLILRASSMGIKMRCDNPGCTENVMIENNLFVEGEIGVGMGGNTDSVYRFINPTVRNNAFLSIGRTHPTLRDISWAVSITDNRNLEISGNLFAHQDTLRNSYAISMKQTLDGAVVRDNVIYGINGTGIRIIDTGWSSVEIRDNVIHDSPLSTVSAFRVNELTEAVSFSGNHIFSKKPSEEWVDWLDQDGTFEDYKTWSGDASASSGEIEFTDPSRSLESYNATLGGEATIDNFVETAVQQRSRFGWNPEYEAQTVLDYLFEGFDM